MKEQNKNKEIVIADNIPFTFPTIDIPNGDMLIVGNFNGICGDLDYSCGNFINDNAITITQTIKSGHRVVIAASKETIEYFNRLLEEFMSNNAFGEKMSKQRKLIRKSVRVIDTTNIYNTIINNNEDDAVDVRNIDVHTSVLDEIYKKINTMKFDVVIQNPPYNKSLHLDFFEKGLEHLTETGKMVIIEPATWLINVRKNGRANRYDAIKEKINGHVKSVIIENFNQEFNTSIDTPFAITTIDISKTFNTIDYICCGEHKIVNSIYDCNLIGEYNTILSIFDKVKYHNDTMLNHIYSKKNNKKYEYYLRYWEYQLYALGTNYCGVVNQYNNKSIAVYRNLPIGEFFSSYVDSLFYGEISENKPLSAKGNLCDCICGSKTELENWIYNVSNNKLFLFLTICSIFDKNNTATNLIPFLSDKKYSEKEIIEKFGFTHYELNFIEKTIKKFQYNSPWFKRYMCGKDSVSDEEVNNFIAEITK